MKNLSSIFGSQLKLFFVALFALIGFIVLGLAVVGTGQKCKRVGRLVTAQEQKRDKLIAVRKQLDKELQDFKVQIVDEKNRPTRAPELTPLRSLTIDQIIAVRVGNRRAALRPLPPLRAYAPEGGSVREIALMSRTPSGRGGAAYRLPVTSTGARGELPAQAGSTEVATVR
ncbi:MAG: hypothetical protein LBV28_03420 [Puniceicoccales bacterium]|nr:hypothetical protein [Puniceicoccales bacterium]